jgi:hypothetical protein
VRIQSSADFSTRGLDAYFTPPEAVLSLIILEGDRLPRRILEPAAGDGAIVNPLLASGRFVVASDIFDYGAGYEVLDYLVASPLAYIEGLVTNPPYKLAEAFAAKAIKEVPYVALLVRTNWLIEGFKRGKWLDLHEPTRVWMSAQRLPMMHRHQWTGKKTTSNTPYSWAIWERDAKREFWQRFYWRELLGVPACSCRKAA